MVECPDGFWFLIRFSVAAMLNLKIEDEDRRDTRKPCHPPLPAFAASSSCHENFRRGGEAKFDSR